MKKTTLAAFVLGTLAHNYLSGPVKQSKPEKSCRKCGKAHTHNNSYCSAECCKADRGQK